MKRILSLLLVLCMMISFLPNISFAADDSLTWTFGYNHTYSADDKTVDSRYTFDNFNADSDSLRWAYVGSCYPKGYAALSSTANNFFKTIFNVDEGTKISYSDGYFATTTFALELPANSSGSYVPKVTLGGASSFPQVDVYLTTQAEFEALSGDTYKKKAANLPASKRIATIDCYVSDIAAEPVWANLALRSGEGEARAFDENSIYYITLVANEPEGDFRLTYDTETKSEYNILNMAIRSFELIPGESDKEEEIRTYNYRISTNSLASTALSDYGVSVFSNDNLAYVSWKSKKDGANPALDKALTDDFELVGRTTNDNSPRLYPSGFTTQFRMTNYAVSSDTETKYYEKSGTDGRSHFALRINIPRAGEYRIEAVNNFSVSDSAISGTINAYENNAENLDQSLNDTSKMDTGMVTQVYFAKADEAYSKKGMGSIVSGGEKLAMYDSREFGKRTELGTITVDAPGEYYLLFDTNAETFAKNSTAYTRFTYSGENLSSSHTWQIFCISEICLIPTDMPELESVSIEYDENLSTVKLTSAKMSDGKDADISGADIKFSISGSDKVTIDEVTGKITSGDETVDVIARVDVTLDGKSVFATLPITVKGIEYSGYYLKYNFAVAEKTVRLDTAVTEEMTKGFWAWGASNRNIPTLSATARYIQLGTYRNDWVALKLNVPAAGVYKTKLTYGVNASTHTGAGPGKIYVLPGNTTDIAAAIGSGASIGEVNFKGSGSAFENDKVKDLENVTFDAPGEYYLVFSALGYSDNAHNMYPTAIEFIGGDTPATVSAFANKDSFVIEEGNRDKLSFADVYLSDYSKADEYEVSYKSANEAVATVDGEGNISGVSEGSTKITATVSHNGTSTTVTVDVLVLARGSSKYRVTYNLASTSDFENATYADTYYFWKYIGTSEIEINVPVAGRYNVNLGKWQGNITIDGNEVSGNYNFPEAGKYVVRFDGEGYPEKIEFYGGEEIAPMGVRMSVNGTVVKVDGIVMSDESTEVSSDAEIRYGIDDFSVAAIDEVTGKLLPGKVGGKTIVRASAKYKGFEVEGELSADIAGEDVRASDTVSTYSFNTASDAWKNANYTAWDDKYGGATTWNVKGITYADTDGWAWHMASSDSYEPKASLWTAAGGISLKPGANGWVAIKLKIPAAGRYWATLVSSKSYAETYGSADIFVVPVSETKEGIEASLTDENFLATLNCNDPGLDAAKAVTDELGAVYFESAGDYLMVFRDMGSNKQVVPRILTLDGMNSIRYADFRLPKSELEVGEKMTATASGRLLDGTLLTNEDATFIYSSSNEEALTFIDGEVEAVGDGEANLTFTALYGAQSVSLTKTVKSKNTSAILGIETVPTRTSTYAGKSVALSSKLIYEKGLPKRLDNSNVTYEVISGTASISDGVVVSKTEGVVEIIAKYGAYTSAPVRVEFRPGHMKNEQTYYTAERVAAAKENIKKYSWAKAEYDGVIDTAEKYLPYVDALYEATVGKGLPRSYKVGYREDPDYAYCRYCGENVEEGYGGFTYNFNRLWKIQCPACKRQFPSNDFNLLYKRGLVNGNYDVAVARQKNAEAVANGEKDALTNELYPELWQDPSSASYNKDPRTGDIVDGKTWGVDDGWGYHTGRTYSNGEPEVHTYVSYFAYKIPNVVSHRVQDFAEAYLYTGEAKYGRAGAILLDRVADVYPEAFTNEFFHLGFATGGGGDDRGKFTGRIGDAERADTYALAADGLFDYLRSEDPQLISYLSQKADEYNLENKKRTWEDIWSNWADNLLWESFIGIKTCHLLGNTGYHQSAAAGIMLVLDEEPRSSEILDWLYTGAPTLGSGQLEYDNNPGGNVAHNFLDLIDRDGMGNESSPTYNLTWVFHFNDLAKYIAMYTDDAKYDLYQNPKFVMMYHAAVPITTVKTQHANVGDANSTASLEFGGNLQSVKDGFRYIKDTSIASDIAEYLYLRNGETAEGLHYDIFTKDPESMESDIESLIAGSVARKSEMMAGYGFAILRDGDEYGKKSTQTYNNNMRDFWIWFGVNGDWSHAHQDALNLGIESFGLNMAPDHGYSESSGNLPSRWQWVRATISHNTIVVNEKNQIYHGKRSTTPLHFDDSGDVKVMDIDASGAYAETSIYRRTLVMVNAGDDVSYGIDFFRVKGGNDHMYSFHSQSDTIYETEGLGEIEYQTDDGTATGNYVGSYAGADVPYGPDPSNSTSESKFVYKSGYTWMKDVRKARDVNKFSVDYNVTDYRSAIKDNKNLHMRLTMLNDFELSEVAMTRGHVPPKLENKLMPEQLEYMLARRTGENLDSLFTTVYEPYKGERYIASTDAVEISTDEEISVDDTAKAVKVVRADGRVDYIVYATNNKVLYTVTDGDVSFDFRGFVGVYSLGASGENIYSYVHDGDLIGESADGKTAYTARVVSFTDELSMDNSITIRPDAEIDLSEIVGRYMFISNDGEENGAYRIESAEAQADGNIKIGIGTISVLRRYKDSEDTSLGYVANIGKGQKVTIPLTSVVDNGPVFVAQKDTSAVAESSISISVNASASDESTVKYLGRTLPRGATIDETSGVITWRPASSQVGKNHFAITAVDEKGRESTVHFVVTVYGSTTGGNGGGAGGGASTPSTPSTSDEEEATRPSTPETPSVEESKRFTDLGAHAWAEDAINALADEGIIKGTSETTFSPANNITRADFTILLVRAFKLESENTENFADVEKSDYYVKELAIARNTGIVGGIGDNKYAPKNNITRQDMMVIVYRAMQKLGVELEVEDIEYADFAEVSDYAKEAVSALITAGLVNGKNGKIAPTDYTTRAEVAVLIKRILDYTK